MFSKFFGCGFPTVIGFVALVALAVAVTSNMTLAADPANSNTAPPTKAELEEEFHEAGKAFKEEAEQIIHHPLGGEPTTDQGHGQKHAGHGGHGKEGGGPLEWKGDLALWTGVVFLVVFGLLYKFAWGPITQGLDKREQGIADNIAAARRSNEEARALLDEYQARLDTAEGEVKAMLDKARADANRTGEKIVEAAKEAAEAEQKRALAEIDQATAGALGELAAQSADLAVSLAGKIVRSELKAADHATLVSEAVSNFGKPK